MHCGSDLTKIDVHACVVIIACKDIGIHYTYIGLRQRSKCMQGKGLRSIPMATRNFTIRPRLNFRLRQFICGVDCHKSSDLAP